MKAFTVLCARYRWLASLIVLLFISLGTLAQGSTATVTPTGTCPINIDFELGSFQNWQCYIGSATTSGTTNVITVTPSTAIAGRHDIIPRGKLTDYYGNFAISPPGTSAYSVKLGNDGTSAQAERISYLFTVPQDQTQFVITYQYAVVLEDPGHAASEQPRFTAKVFDITANAYITCGSFDYVATANLPGFKKGFGDVIYKDWTPVTINLYGYQGHQLRLEFTTADCTLGGHFGYAYVDVSANCSSLVNGTNFCPSEPSAVLDGPSGFSTYKWYSADRSKILGTNAQLVITPPPADGTVVLLDMVPYTGFGCPYTVSSTLHALPVINMKVTDPAQVCFPSTVDITDTNLVSGSDGNLTYGYYSDASATIALKTPNAIATSGKYYIKATAPSGCNDIMTINVTVNPLPTINITNPATICLLTPVDVTAAAIVNGSSPGLTYSYWTDAAATKLLANPTKVTTAGTYYIKGINLNGCITIKPVVVTFFDLPILVIINPPAVCYPGTVDMTAAAVTQGSDSNLTFTYFYDAAASLPIPSPTKIPQSGVYYIRATNTNGCIKTMPVTVTVNALPVLTISNPGALCTPDKADLTAANITIGSSNYAKFTYWRDAAATVAITKPEAVPDSGRYYIKATSIAGCEVVEPVDVVIHHTPVVVIKTPSRVYVPNTVDITNPAIVTKSTVNLTYTYWTDASATDAVTNPKGVDKTGTYYIKGTNKYGCFDIKPVNVNVILIPLILAPKAFTPTHTENNRLYPFLVGVKTLVSFKVYNHWGNLVFQTETADPAKGWDGTFKGQYQFMDTYTWYAEGIDYFGKIVQNSGNTLLLK